MPSRSDETGYRDQIAAEVLEQRVEEFGFEYKPGYDKDNLHTRRLTAIQFAAAEGSIDPDDLGDETKVKALVQDKVQETIDGVNRSFVDSLVAL